MIDRQQLDRRDAVAPRDAVRYEPAVSVGNQPTRAGSTNYVICGIGKNCVRVQIDGVRVSAWGTAAVSGARSDVLRAAALEDCFGVPVREVSDRGGRVEFLPG